MKKTLTTILIGGLFSLTVAQAQTNNVDTNQPGTAASADTGGTNTATVVDTNAPAVTTTTTTTTSITNTTATTIVTNDVTVTTAVATETNAVPDVSTNAVPAGTNSIPLIQFQDISLTTAIENLARQANINYLLDPKIGFGQPDQNGQPKPEPTLSIRWENITPEHALLALLDNYGLQLVYDRKTEIARITVKDPTALPPLSTRVVQLKFTSVSNMTDAVQSVLTDKRSRVLPDARTSQLVVVATDAEQASVDTLVPQLDKPTREVLIETRLVEISSNPTSNKGIDWTGTLQAQNVSFGNGNVSGTYSQNTVPTTTTVGSHTITSQLTTEASTLTTAVGAGGFNANTASGLTPDIGFLNADGLHAVLSFLNSSSEAQVMSTPRIVTLDNETANIEVTRGYPIFNVSSSSANNSGGSSVTYSNVGTKLKVTPRITASDNIWLKVVPEVSSFFGNFSQTVGGGAGGGNQTLTAPVFDSRTFQTQVLVHNQNTLVMGGLVKDNPQSSTTKVPLLGDIPLLGYAFRSDSKSLDKENLLVFITPTIVKDTDFQTPLVESTTFLKSRPDTKRAAIMDVNSMWDNTTPHDWSNPKGRQVTDSQ
jgi:type II secretory pathway component GspD/PulD (secretin)